MHILENYFNNFPSLELLKKDSNVIKALSNREFKLIQGLYSRSTLYEIPVKYLSLFSQNYKESRFVEKINGFSYFDPDYFVNIDLPTKPIYAHFDKPIQFKMDNVSIHSYLNSILISKEYCIMFLTTEKEGQYQLCVPVAVYKGRSWIASLNKGSYLQTDKWMASFVITAIEYILGYQATEMDRSNDSQYTDNYKRWNRKKLIPSPTRYYKMEGKPKEFIEEVKTIQSSSVVLDEYFMLSLEIKGDPKFYKFTRVGEFLPKAQLFEISFRECLNQTSGDYDDDITLDSLNLPADYLFVGLTDMPPIVSGSAETTMLTKSIFISKTIIVMTFSMLLTGEPKLSFTYENGKWNIDDTRLDILKQIHRIVDYINSFQTIIINRVNDSQFSKTCKNRNKHNKVPNPPFYYRVGLKKAIVETTTNHLVSSNRKECDYAYMVRGHSVYRIGRGSLPLDNELLERLKKDPRRYIYLSPSDISDKHLTVLEERGITVQEGEWVTLLESYRKSHIANSKGGKNPYIPSIHTDQLL